MAEFNLKNALEIAITAEEYGAKFYIDFAKKVKNNDELKATLELLAKDEMEHKKHFIELSKISNVEYNVSEVDLEFLKFIDISKHFTNFKDVEELEPIEILKQAFSFEKKTVLFYLAIKDIIGESDIISSIINFEKKHMQTLFKYIVSDSKFRGISDKFD